jgi:Flp pilus assembly protein TadG
MRKRLAHSPGERRATLTLELLLVLPIALVIILAIVEFSMIFTVRQQLSAASREGARVASIGGTAEEIEAAVRTFLGNGTLSQAKVISVLTDEFGDPVPSGGAVQVIVTLPTAQAVPNLLAPFGFSIGNDVIYARTTMRKE